jgi:hypothetical protein
LVPIDDRLIVKLFEKVDVVILYHTSSSGVPVAHPTGIPELAVASQTVPELFIVPEVKAVAPEQSSFEGGPVTVISKFALLLIDVEPNEYTLMK